MQHPGARTRACRAGSYATYVPGASERWFVVDGVQYRLVSCIFRAARGQTERLFERLSVTPHVRTSVDANAALAGNGTVTSKLSARP